MDNILHPIIFSMDIKSFKRDQKSEILRKCKVYNKSPSSNGFSNKFLIGGLVFWITQQIVGVRLNNKIFLQIWQTTEDRGRGKQQSVSLISLNLGTELEVRPDMNHQVSYARIELTRK